MSGRRGRTVEAPPKTGGADLFGNLETHPDDAEAPNPGAIERATPAPAPVTRVEARETTIDALSLIDPVRAGAILKARADLLSQAQAIAIQKCGPHGFTLFKDRSGEKVVGSLRDAGAVSVRKWLGISIFNHRPVVNGVVEPRITEELIAQVDKEGKETGVTLKVLVAEMWADGMCAVTGETVEDVYVGLRSMDEQGRSQFVGRGHLQDLKAACRTSLDTKVVAILSGLRKVDQLILKANGIDLNECFKGHGFGTSTDRAGKGVAEEGVEPKKKALHEEILRRVGGDMDAYRGVLKDVSLFQGKRGPMWKNSIDEFTLGWQIDRAFEALKAHPTFGDRAAGGAKNGARQPGEDG